MKQPSWLLTPKTSLLLVYILFVCFGKKVNHCLLVPKSTPTNSNFLPFFYPSPLTHVGANTFASPPPTTSHSPCSWIPPLALPLHEDFASIFQQCWPDHSLKSWLVHDVVASHLYPPCFLMIIRIFCLCHHPSLLFTTSHPCSIHHSKEEKGVHINSLLLNSLEVPLVMPCRNPNCLKTSRKPPSPCSYLLIQWG